MVAAQHPTLGMVDGNGPEFSDVLDGFAGKDGQEGAGAYQVQDGGNAVVFQAYVQVHVSGEEDGFQHVPGLQALEGQGQRIAAQSLDGDGTVAVAEFVLPPDQTQPVLEKRPGIDPVIVDGGFVGKGDVQLPVEQFLLQLRPGGADKMKPDLGIKPVEIPDGLPEQGSERIGGAYRERSGTQTFHVLDDVRTHLGVFYHLHRVREELLSIVAQRDVPRVAGQQLHAQFFLQLPYLLGYGTLGDIQGLGREGEAPELGNLYEIL